MRFVVLIVVITVAVVVGLGMLWISGGQQSAQVQSIVAAATPASQVATVDVLVARNDIPIGTALTEDMIDRQPWPRHLVLEGFVTGDSKDVAGMVARNDFKAREPLITSKLSRLDEASYMAASLAKGMRAVTLAVDPISGVAGYLFPGDRVDVILTHSLVQESASQQPTAAEVLFPDLKVLAVNTRRGSAADKSADDAEPPGSITIEMTQEDTKKLRLAEKNGQLSLALRSIEDKGDETIGQPVTVRDITQVRGKEHVNSPVRAAPDEVLVVRGLMGDAPAGASGN